MTSFSIDERSFLLRNETANEWIDRIENLLDFVDDLLQRGHSLVYSEDLFEIPIAQGFTIYELTSPNSPVSPTPEFWQRVSVIFGRASRWTDLDIPTPRSLSVAIGSAAITLAPAVAWSHSSTVAAQYLPCVSQIERGEIAVNVEGETRQVWFITNPTDVELFFRFLIVETTKNIHEMSKYTSDAFTQLIFISDCLDGIKEMSLSYRDIIGDVVKCLAVLSDNGKVIFGGSWRDAPAKFGSLGVTLSDENGNTKGKPNAASARKRTVNGKSEFFWWHVKLRVDRDRIHFLPNSPDYGDKIVIGIFCRHLST